jgi:hypothetical protein
VCKIPDDPKLAPHVPASYLLIASKASTINGGYKPVLSVITARHAHGVWPLYYRTAFKNTLVAGDCCFLYAGSRGATVVGRATVKSNSPLARSALWFEDEELLVDRPDRVLTLVNWTMFAAPVSIRPLLPSLDLCRHRTVNWGAFMQGGCKRLTDHDARLLNRAAEKANRK